MTPSEVEPDGIRGVIPDGFRQLPGDNQCPANELCGNDRRFARWWSIASSSHVRLGSPIKYDVGTRRLQNTCVRQSSGRFMEDAFDSHETVKVVEHESF
jgi:hypothetical protein